MDHVQLPALQQRCFNVKSGLRVKALSQAGQRVIRMFIVCLTPRRYCTHQRLGVKLCLRAEEHPVLFGSERWPGQQMERLQELARLGARRRQCRITEHPLCMFLQRLRPLALQSWLALSIHRWNLRARHDVLPGLYFLPVPVSQRVDRLGLHIAALFAQLFTHFGQGEDMIDRAV